MDIYVVSQTPTDREATRVTLADLVTRVTLVDHIYAQSLTLHLLMMLFLHFIRIPYYSKCDYSS